MTYAFRPHLFKKQRTVRLTDEGIEELAPDGRVKRTILYRNVSSLNEVVGGTAHDPDKGTFTRQYVVLSGRGRKLTIKGDSYLGPHDKGSIDATNHAAEYEPLVAELKRRLVVANPDVPLVEGHLLASLIGGASALIGLVGFPLMALSILAKGNGPLWELGVGALFIFGLGLLMGLACLGLARTYWPKKRRLAETLQGVSG